MPYPTSWDGRTAYARCAPSKPASQEIKVLKIFPGVDYNLLIVSTRPCVVAVHYDGRRTLPCCGQQGVCWFDHATGDTREQTWLTVFDWKKVDHRAVALTPGAAWECLPIRDPSVGLRGAHLRIGRSGNELQSPMWCKVDPQSPMVCRHKLPEEINLLDFLRKMWRAPLTKNLDGARKPFTSPVPDWDRGADLVELPAPVADHHAESRAATKATAEDVSKLTRRRKS